MALQWDDLAHSLSTRSLSTLSSSSSRSGVTSPTSTHGSRKGRQPRKTLPYPLPDPFAEDGAAVYDPHGSFTAEKPVSGNGHVTASTFEPLTLVAEPAKLGDDVRIERVPSLSPSGMDSQPSKDSDVPPEPMQTDPIPIDFSQGPRSPSTAPTYGAINALNRLRIGSASAGSDVGSITSSSYFFVDQPKRTDSPGRFAFRGMKDTSSVYDDASMDDAASMMPEGPMSPAQSFMSAFSRSVGTGTSFRVPEGGDEGFVMADHVLGGELGRGAFGVVRSATRLSDGELVAVKIVRHRSAADPGKVAEGIRRRATTLERHRSSSNPAPPHVGAKGRNFSFTPMHTSRPTDLSASMGSLPPQQSVDEEDEVLGSLLEREISLWSALAPHPHILPLLSVHHTEGFSYIFMPLCTGGNLLTFFNTQSEQPVRGRRNFSLPISPPLPSLHVDTKVANEVKGLPLALALPIFAQIVSGLHYLHTEAGVTHKDLKLENILQDSAGTWMIADFGLAEASSTTSAVPGRHAKAASERPTPSLVHPLHSLNRAVSLTRPGEPSLAVNSSTHPFPAGSLPYASPEVLASSTPVTAHSVDIWALGCILFALVSGSLPFSDEFEPRLRMKILRAQWDLPSVLKTDPTTPGGGINLVGARMVEEILRGCLEVDVAKRWTIERVKDSDWLREDRGRGRSRGRAGGPRAGSSGSGGSANRRKERSTSRGTGVRHLGIDENTRSREREEREREEKRGRWSEGRKTKSKSRTRTREGTLEVVCEPY